MNTRRMATASWAVLVALPGVWLGAYEADAHRDILREALRPTELVGLCFTGQDLEDMLAGVVHEDDINCVGNMRFRHHGYNPVTGAPFDVPLVRDELRATERADRLWSNMNKRWKEGERNGVYQEGESCDGHFGGFTHYLGRVVHMLEDMASPGHAHAPDGHGGWEAALGYDFESYWRCGIDFDTDGIQGTLTPLSGFPESPIWGSKMRQEDWTRMRESILALNATDSIGHYMRTMALVTYHHTRFYGHIRAENPPVPPGRSEEPFSRMFGSRMDYDSFLNAWLIDGVGWYEHEFCSDAWWPEVDRPRKGGEPDTKVRPDGSAVGYFYTFATHNQWGWPEVTCNLEEHDAGSAWPRRWPNGEDNSGSRTTLGRHYGEVLIPWVVRLTRGLIRRAWPLKDSRVVLENSWRVDSPQLRGLAVTLSGEKFPCRVEVVLGRASYDRKGKMLCGGECAIDGSTIYTLAGTGSMKGTWNDCSYSLKLRDPDRRLRLSIRGRSSETQAAVAYSGPGCRGKGKFPVNLVTRPSTAILQLFPAIWSDRGSFRGSGLIATEYGNDCEGNTGCPGKTELSGRLRQREGAEVLTFELRCGRQSVSFAGRRGGGHGPFVGTLKYRLPPARGIVRDHNLFADEFLSQRPGGHPVPPPASMSITRKTGCP